MVSLEFSSVDELMRAWPSTIRVFMDYGMACCGCPIGSFHTVEDACREHDKDQAAVMAGLRDAIASERI